MNDEDVIRTLEATGDYRVLRRLRRRTRYNDPDGTETKLAIFLDLETTGLDPSGNEIIELAMVPFEFSSDGRIFAVHEPYNALQEPSSGSVPEEITRITGITTEMVRGHKIDAAKVAEVAAPAAVIIAHNASFDRKFTEKAFDVFTTKAWACSMTQVPWTEEGFDGTKLEYLAMKSGFFYSGHRATADCYAAIELLSKPLPQSGTLALQALLEEARKPTCRIWAGRVTLRLQGHPEGPWLSVERWRGWSAKVLVLRCRRGRVRRRAFVPSQGNLPARRRCSSRKDFGV